MDLRSFRFHAQRGEVRLRFSNGHIIELQGQAVIPILTFAAELVAQVASRKRGELSGLDVDLGLATLHAAVRGRDTKLTQVYIQGRDFERLVRPAAGAVVRWAEARLARDLSELAFAAAR